MAKRYYNNKWDDGESDSSGLGGDTSIPELNLHGLRLSEALDDVEDFLDQYYRDEPRLIIITGNGAVLKPGVQKYLDDRDYDYEEDPDDSGQLIVYRSDDSEDEGSDSESTGDPPELDLRGFHLEEALEEVKQFLDDHHEEKQLIVTTGKGAVLKPEVEQYLDDHGYDYEEDPDDIGQLIVHQSEESEEESEEQSADSESGDPPELDLRGFHLQEALEEVKEFLDDHHEEKRLIVITGKGAVLKPEVEAYLDDHGYNYDEDSDDCGQLIVHRLPLDESDSSEYDPPELDLHGFHLQEALDQVEDFLDEYYDDEPILIIITGQGLHSPHGPVLKPGVGQYLAERGYDYEKDLDNGGQLIVRNRSIH